MPDRAVRRLMAGAVLIVAVIAAVVSYIHIQHLAVSHGQSWLAALLLPVSVDGTITAASLALLYAARAGLPSPRLGRMMLGLGVAATVAANAVEGASGGLIGVIVSAWPAVAFIGGIELLVWAARTARLSAPAAVSETAIVSAPETTGPAAPEAAPATAPENSGRMQPAAPELAAASTPAATVRTRQRGASGSGTKVAPETRAERRYAGLLAAGELPSIRAIARDIKVGAPKAKAIRAHLSAAVAA